MISALGDCVPVLQRVKHEPSPQVMLELFEKEIGDTLHEVSMLIKKFLFYELWMSFRTLHEEVLLYQRICLKSIFQG